MPLLILFRGGGGDEAVGILFWSMMQLQTFCQCENGISISSLRWVENIFIPQEEKRNMYANLYLGIFVPLPLLRHERDGIPLFCHLVGVGMHCF